MLILETVSCTDQGVTVTQRLLSAAFTLTEVNDLLDQAVEAASEPKDHQGLVFEAQAQIGRRIVVGAQDRLGTDLTVVSIRRAQQADDVRELTPAVQALAALGDAPVKLTGWQNAGRQLDVSSLQAAGLCDAFAQTLGLVSLPFAPITVQAQQAASLIWTEYGLLLDEGT